MLKNIIRVVMIVVLTLYFSFSIFEAAAKTKRDERLVFDITSLPGNGFVKSIRLQGQWWTLMGQPVEYHKFTWTINDRFGIKNTGKVLTRDSLAEYPDLVSRFEDLKPTDIEVKLSFELRRTSRASCKSPNFYSGLSPTVRGNRYLKETPDLMVRESGKVGDDISPGTPIDEYKGMELEWETQIFSYDDRRDRTDHRALMTKSTLQCSSEIEATYLSISKIEIPWDRVERIYDDWEKREKDCTNPKNAQKNRCKKDSSQQDDFWSGNGESKANDTLPNGKNDSKPADGFWAGANDDEESTGDFWGGDTSAERAKRLFLAAFHVDSPVDNYSSNKNVAWLEGRVDLEKIRGLESLTYYILVNEQKQQFHVDSNGRFRSAVVLGAGDNRVSLIAEYGGLRFQESRQIRYTGKRSRLRATLTWNGSADMDLHLFDPEGTHISFRNKHQNSISLDVDNTSAYGPENISVPSSIRGEYKIQVVNYSKTSGITATVHIFVDERLENTYQQLMDRNRKWEAVSIPMN